MYKLIYLAGLLVRQFLLPNPFEAMWPDRAFVLNWIFGIVLCPVSYCLTGLVYSRGDGAAAGSLMFNVIYIALTFVLWGAIALLKIITDNLVISLVILSSIIVIILGVVLLLWIRKRNKKIQEAK